MDTITRPDYGPPPSGRPGYPMVDRTPAVICDPHGLYGCTTCLGVPVFELPRLSRSALARLAYGMLIERTAA